MARRVSLYEAKTHLSRLVDEAAKGETIVIAKAGKPMARLGPVSGGRKLPRCLGQLARRSHNIDWEEWWQEWKAADREIEDRSSQRRVRQRGQRLGTVDQTRTQADARACSGPRLRRPGVPPRGA